MFEDWKAKLLFVVAVIAIIGAVVFASQNVKPRKELAATPAEVTTCQDSSTSLQQQVNPLTGDLNALRNNYDVMRTDYDQLKARRGRTGKSTRVH